MKLLNGVNAVSMTVTDLARARGVRTPIAFVPNSGGEGDPDAPGTPGWELHPALQPSHGDLVLDKTSCDTFASMPLG